MTTDTVPKESAVEVDLGHGRTAHIAGMAKGSGMIHPQMATMLAFLTTDAPIAPTALRDNKAKRRSRQRAMPSRCADSRVSRPRKKVVSWTSIGS